MGQQEIYAVLMALRAEDSLFRSVKQINKALEERGFMPGGYATTHYSLMSLARCGLIEMEAPPSDPFREWSRRFRGKEKEVSNA